MSSSMEPNLACDRCGDPRYSAAVTVWIGRPCYRGGCGGKLISVNLVPRATPHHDEPMDFTEKCS